MARPKLTPQETYLLNAMKAQTSSVTNAGMWSFLIATGVIAVWGAYLDAMPIVFIAFCIIVGFRIFEERNHLRWTPHVRSLVEKLEHACSGTIVEAPVEVAGETVLIQCTDCQGVVSKNAQACPHCGCPVIT